MAYSKERIIFIGQYFENFGEDKTKKTFSLKSETLNRLIRQYKNIKPEYNDNRMLSEIQDRYTPQELKQLAKGQRLSKEIINVVPFNFSGNHVRFASISDTHFGSIYSVKKIWEKVVKQIKSESCEFVVHSGDIVDGMFSNHEGQIYELNKFGYDAQRDYAVELLSLFDLPLYAISGNHDRTFMKKDGANIVKDICSRIKNAQYIGHDTGEIILKKNIILQPWHGEDGSSYAVSYRIQKICEAFTGGRKPHILLAGHAHKSMYAMIRNIHCISSGAITLQSNWMRSKRLENHSGFWIIDIWINKYGISKFQCCWHPFYN